MNPWTPDTTDVVLVAAMAVLLIGGFVHMQVAVHGAGVVLRDSSYSYIVKLVLVQLTTLALSIVAAIIGFTIKRIIE